MGSSAIRINQRKAPRESVAMMAKCRKEIATFTVMLKDLSAHGALIEGVGHMGIDEALSLALPGCRPMMAFVAWSNDHCAGLEFAQPLQADLFSSLIATYGLREQTAQAGGSYPA